MYLHTPAVEAGSWWRVDTASGSDTGTTVYAHDGTDAIPNYYVLTGSTVRNTTRDGTAQFWSAAATLYLKELTYQGAPNGTVVTSTGVTPAAPVGGAPVDIATISTTVAALPTTYVKLLVTDATSATLTGTLAAGHLSPVDCTVGPGVRTLPAANSVAIGTPTVAKKADTTTNTLTVQRAGSDLIFGTGAGSTSKTLTLSGEAVTFVSNGVDRWSVESSDTPSSAIAAGYAPIAATPVASSATSGTLTAGAEHNLSPTSAAAWTLPTSVSATKLPTTVKNNGTATVTVARGGSDTINGGTTSVSIAATEWARFTSDGAGAWTQSGTAGQSGTYGQLWTSPAASTTLTGTLGAWVITAVDCTAGTGARTLPAANSVTAGTAVCAKKADTSTNTLVVSRAGSDLIYGTGSGATSKTLSLAGEAVEFVSNGVDKWTVRASDTPGSVLATTYAPIDRHLRPSIVSAPRGAAPVMVAQACASGHSWTNSSTTGTVSLNDTTDFLLGSQSISLVTAGTGASSCHTTVTGLTLDLTGRQPVIWVKCDDVTKLKAIEIRIGDNGFANFFYFEFESALTASQNDRYLRSGKWTCLRLPWGAAGTSTGAPNRAALTSVRLTAIDYGSSAPATVHFNGFGYQPEQSLYTTGVCSFTFDDGYIDTWSTARPLLDKYGWTATELPIVDLIASSGSYMTLANLTSLQDDYGWEIGAHSYTAAAHNTSGGLPALTAAARQAELRNVKMWLADNGFKGGDYFAYPQGLYDDATIADVKTYFAAARTQSQFRRETVPVTDRWRTRTVNLGSNITIATAQGYVTEAANNKEWINFTSHKLGASASDGSTWATADFTTLLSSINSAGMTVRPYGHILRSVASLT